MKICKREISRSNAFLLVCGAVAALAGIIYGIVVLVRKEQKEDEARELLQNLNARLC